MHHDPYEDYVPDDPPRVADIMQDEFVHLIRQGIVCGTCADEGETSCNCYDMLPEED